MNFTDLAQKNVDHYNDHPVQHNVITAVYAVVALVAVGFICKKIAGADKYAK